MFPAFQRAKTFHALARAATVTGTLLSLRSEIEFLPQKRHLQIPEDGDSRYLRVIGIYPP
jgi:hypothetical protein